MKYFLALLVVFATAAGSRADTLVSVTIEPTTYHVIFNSPDETIGATFTWDVPSNVLSNFVITQSGPLPTFTFASASFGSSYIDTMGFADGQGDVFSVFREEAGLTNIGNTPGTYTPLGLDLICKQPGCIEGEFINIGTAVVTTAPTPTPEPGTLVLLGVGFVGLLARKTRRSDRFN